MQDVTDQKTRYTAIIKSLGSKSTDKCKRVIVEQIYPGSNKCFIVGVSVYKKNLSPCIKKVSSCVRQEIVKIHKKQNWFKRCGLTLFDNGAGLGMAVLSSKIVEDNVEVEQFSNLWGLLATRPVVSEGTYEVLSFTVEFIIALIVFTLTEHYLAEYRQRKNITEESADNSNTHSAT